MASAQRGKRDVVTAVRWGTGHRWRRGSAAAAGGALALSLLVAPAVAPAAAATPGAAADPAVADLQATAATLAATLSTAAPPPAAADYSPGLVVKYAPNVVAPLSADAPVPGAAATGVDLSPGAPVGLGWYEADFPTPVDQQTAQALAEQLMADPAVEYAEPQIWMRPVSTPAPDDPRWLQQWGFASYGEDDFVFPGTPTDRPLDQQTTGTNLLEALAAPRGDAPTVAVIDTGITNHPDLAGRMTTGYNFISSPATARNAFGRGPDFYDPGDWITAEEASELPFSLNGCGAPSDSSWHGTHVSGTIAALTDNGLGVAGTLPAEIQTLRALGRCGGSGGDIGAAMLWASGGSVPGVQANPSPARVVNLSLGGGAECPQYFQDAIDYGTARGTVFVVAAGNNNGDAAAFTPANCAGVITVAATDPYGGRASFSNFGPYVDVAAPGLGVMSTLNSGLQEPQTPNYASYGGTSMAAPHVAGAVALLLAAEPDLTAQQVHDRVKATATPFKQATSFVGRGGRPANPAYDCVGDDPCGAGYLNTAALLGQPNDEAPVVAPRFQVRALGAASAAGDAASDTGAPVGALNGSVEVRFTFQPSPSGAEDYLYSIALGPTVLAEGTTTATDVTVSVPGSITDEFTVLITPRTGAETGVAAQAMAVPALEGAAPPAPTIEAVSTNDSFALVTVTNTYAMPTIQATQVVAEPGGHQCQLATLVTDSSCFIEGLTPGVEYTFTATSSNAVGTSDPSTPVKATPQPDAPPTAPTVNSVVMQGATATVSWTPSVPSTGREISMYAVQAVGTEPGQVAECFVSSYYGGPPQTNSCQVPNLYVGQEYQFIVRAIDDMGAISSSAPSEVVQVVGTAVPPSRPDAPPTVDVSDGTATAGVSVWGATSFNGGSPILGYRFVASPGGASCDLPYADALADATCQITGLTNGQPYTFTALAFNEMGGSAPSDPTVALTPGVPVPTGELSVLDEPVRVLDTRTDGGPVDPGSPRTVDVQAPDGAIAVAYNLTVTGTTGSGYATVYPAGEAMPGTSVSNWNAANQTVANGYVSGLGEAGSVTVAVAGTAAQVVFDVVGYYAPPVAPVAPEAAPAAAAPVAAGGAAAPVEAAAAPVASQEFGEIPAQSGGRFLPMAPARAYDSRTADGALAGGTSRTVDLSAQVPVGTQAVAYTLTETGTTGSGYLAVGQPGQGAPTTSVINWTGPGQTMANSSVAAVNGARQFEVFAGSSGTTQFVVDVIGYFATIDVSPDGLVFTPITPQRAYDSRMDSPGGPITGGTNRTTSLAISGVPAGAPAVAANLTATGTTGSGWLALTPGGTKASPGISTLNWWRPSTTVANGTVTGTVEETVTTFAAGGSTQYILDVAGYYHRPRS